MVERNRTDGSALGAAALAFGGIAAAFGAASCCALPLLLDGLGLGSAWLAGLALLAAPYRGILLGGAVLCIAGAGAMWLRARRRAPECAAGSVCARPAATALIASALSLGAVLTVLGFVFA
jgi:mercuric ion transport protein